MLNLRSVISPISIYKKTTTFWNEICIYVSFIVYVTSTHKHTPSFCVFVNFRINLQTYSSLSVSHIHPLKLKQSNACLILHWGNEGDCLHAPGHCFGSPWKSPVEIYNFLIGCPLHRIKCPGALALIKRNQWYTIPFKVEKRRTWKMAP